MGAVPALLMMLWMASADIPATVSPTVEVLAEEIRKAGRVESAAIYYGGEPSEVYATYEKLRDAASREELLTLLDDRHPAVRVYALMAMKEKFPETDLFSLVMGRLADSSCVETQFGCIRSTQFVADLMVQEILPDLHPDQMDQLQTWLLNQPNNLMARYEVLASGPLASKHHDAVRKLAKSSVHGSLTALASYRDEADVEIIVSRIRPDCGDSLLAAARYPHPKFFPLLAEMHQKFTKDTHWSNEMRAYYGAVAAYKTPEARKILRSVLDLPESYDLRDYHVKFAFEAIVSHCDDSDTDLLFAFWEAAPLPAMPYPATPEGPYPEETLLVQLLEADRNRTLENIKAQFQRKDFYVHYEQSLQAMTALLLREMSPAEAFALINRGLAVANVHQLPVLCKFVAEYKPESSIPILFDRLTQTDNAYIMVAATEAILAYGRRDLRERIEGLLTSGTIPKDNWGHEAVQHLVEKHKAGESQH